MGIIDCVPLAVWVWAEKGTGILYEGQYWTVL